MDIKGLIVASLISSTVIMSGCSETLDPENGIRELGARMKQERKKADQPIGGGKTGETLPKGGGRKISLDSNNLSTELRSQNFLRK
ncbi:hypothetical protein CLIBASIA_04530 [Candidatus Liberibacter asiaticus str. psy62]|uniref:Lipoprotein n=1 Tax=Liberibacter asiaticus (strain psy62) TaxID=537021 RepID=C6XGH5_LIBAP|nr:hypothetical protein [Candidatus Liberibacter asiaticus]ACT57478.1 hypothetical protein CLIBASIA_04530 [Candidatus Liberibacter asiaticus str. psy62]